MNHTLKFFKLSEFDSPDAPGSGANMDKEFLYLIDKAREHAGVPFKINSGYRTKAHHDALAKRGYKTAKNSAHLTGHAADIHCTDSAKRYRILEALMLVGFDRIGIADTFIHVDNDPGKPEEVIWLY
jgi:zinc D-Ala-D-Ala carboxypeptidase